MVAVGVMMRVERRAKVEEVCMRMEGNMWERNGKGRVGIKIKIRIKIKKGGVGKRKGFLVSDWLGGFSVFRILPPHIFDWGGGRSWWEGGGHRDCNPWAGEGWGFGGGAFGFGGRVVVG